MTEAKAVLTDGNQYQHIGIDISKNSDGNLTLTLNISASVSPGEIITHIYTQSYNIPQQVSALRILDTLIERYIACGKLTGHMVTQIIENHIKIQMEPYDTYLNM